MTQINDLAGLVRASRRWQTSRRIEAGGESRELPADAEIARQVWSSLTERHPGYAEMHDILSLAAETWPRFGISAADLAGLDDTSLAMLRLALAE